MTDVAQGGPVAFAFAAFQKAVAPWDAAIAKAQLPSREVTQEVVAAAVAVARAYNRPDNHVPGRPPVESMPVVVTWFFAEQFEIFLTGRMPAPIAPGVSLSTAIKLSAVIGASVTSASAALCV